MPKHCVSNTCHGQTTYTEEFTRPASVEWAVGLCTAEGSYDAFSFFTWLWRGAVHAGKEGSAAETVEIGRPLRSGDR